MAHAGNNRLNDGLIDLVVFGNKNREGSGTAIMGGLSIKALFVHGKANGVLVRDAKPKCAALRRRAFDADFTAHQLDQTFADRQPKP